MPKYDVVSIVSELVSAKISCNYCYLMIDCGMFCRGCGGFYMLFK